MDVIARAIGADAAARHAGVTVVILTLPFEDAAYPAARINPA
jgi:hypothetical protein